jgi:hypothetical protein
MRFGFVRVLAVGCVCALTSLAQQQLSVSKLVEFIHSSITLKTSDKEVAGFLAGVKLTEKLDTRTVESLQGQGAGPKTVEALMRLATASASLTPPAPTIAAPKPKPLDPPSYEEQQKVLDAAREYALNYTKNLPDFICLEVTHRYYDPHYRPGTEGSWAVSDKLAEKLTYYDQKEKYELISRNDDSLYGKSSDSVGGALSRNEFGTLMKEVFDPGSSAEFHWERWSTLSGHLMYVYTYHIDQPHSHWTLDYEHRQQVTPAYHGEVFVDKGSNEIWRISVEPEPPASFPMQNIHEALDYRYTDVGGQQFLLPQKSEVIMRADGVGTKNDLEFRSYKKYSADATITFDDTEDTAAPSNSKPKDQKPKQ